jgi:hypothetical protein
MKRQRRLLPTAPRSNVHFSEVLIPDSRRREGGTGRTCGLETDLGAPRSLQATKALRSCRAGAGSGRPQGRGPCIWAAALPGRGPGGARGDGGVPGAEWPGGERAALVHHHRPVCGLPGAGESWSRVPPGPGRQNLAFPVRTPSPPAHCVILGALANLPGLSFVF